MDENTLIDEMSTVHDNLKENLDTLSKSKQQKLFSYWRDLDKALFRMREKRTTPETSKEELSSSEEEFFCGKCDTMEVKDGWNYCPKCGMKLNWDEKLFIST